MAICSVCKEERFRSFVIDGEFVCKDCHPTYVFHRHQVFPFTTNHIGGPAHPITVNSLYHLRQIEKSYGVQVAAFHMDEKNMSAEAFVESNPVQRDYNRVNFGRWQSREDRR